MEVQDYYKTLGVPRTASQAEIKKAFRKLAREYHPDKRPGDRAAERRFKDLNEANEVLSDPKKREKYDRFGRDWEAYERAGAAAGAAGGADPFGPGSPFARYARGGGASGAGTGPGGIRYEFHTTGDAGDFSDFFRMMFGEDAGPAGNGGPANGGRGSEGGRASRARAGGGSGGGRGGLDDFLSGIGFGGRHGGSTADAGSPYGEMRALPAVEATTELSLEEAFHGTTRIVEVGGKRLEVSIPPGVDTGSRVKLTGKGPDGRDLVVVVRVQPHATFTRRGPDLEREIPVSLGEALVGAEVPVGTLKGRVLLTIPPGTQNGTTFRLTRQGMPRLRGGERGDLYVRVRVVLPTHLSEEAKAAAERFLDLVHQPDPRA